MVIVMYKLFNSLANASQTGLFRQYLRVELHY